MQLYVSLREGSDQEVLRWQRVMHNFNPRSREGSDHCGDYLVMLEDISIHAPVKGATGRHDKVGFYSLISIHAPVKGATGNTVRERSKPLFQSTLP